MSKPQDKPRRALGKGLSALLPTRPVPVPAPTTAPFSDGKALSIPINSIDPSPLQPRTVFDASHLQELAESIRSNGVIQPLIVRRKADRYEIVAGERRLRSAKLAGLIEVPVIVQELADERVLEVALIENLQREDLNPIETAQAFQRLVAELHLTHEEIAHRTGKDRTTITNTLRLLKLPGQIQLLLAEHRLSMGHARALLGLSDEQEQIEIANRAAVQGQSVRQIEKIVSHLTGPRATTQSEPKPLDPNVKAAVRSLEDALGTRVRIVERSPQRGRLEIEYYSLEDLDRIYRLIVTE